VLGPGVPLHQQHGGVRGVVGVRELPQLAAGAPHDDLGGAAGLGVVEPPDQRRDDVGALRRERVARAVQVVGRRHDGVHAVVELGAVRLAHLDANDLGDGIPEIIKVGVKFSQIELHVARPYVYMHARSCKIFAAMDDDRRTTNHSFPGAGGPVRSADSGIGWGASTG